MKTGPSNPLHPVSGLRAAGFSLLEVAVAAGLLGVTLAGVLGLLGATARSGREIVDAAVAARLADGTVLELRRLGIHNVESTIAAGPLPLVAAVDGVRVVAAADAGNDPVAGRPPGLPPDEQYFLVEIARAVTPADTAAQGVLVLAVRVSWPFRRPGMAAPVPATERAVRVFPVALTP